MNKDISVLRAWLLRRDLPTIAIDADDTLWHDGLYFRKLRARLFTIGQRLGHPSEEAAKLLDVHLRSSDRGEAGYAAAIRQAAADLGLSGSATAELEESIETFITHGTELLEYARESLELLAPYRKVLVTKGVFQEQERKLAESGCQQYFEEIRILQSKTTQTIKEAFDDIRQPGHPLVMIGNSVTHDIVPAVRYGAWAIWLNHEHNDHGRNEPLPPEACEVSSWRVIYDVLLNASGVE